MTTRTAARHRNDPVQFVWLNTRGQAEFVGAFGFRSIEEAQLPRVVAVRTGKRPRYALSEPGALEAPSIRGFVDNILGGGATFKKLAEVRAPEHRPRPSASCLR